MTVKHSKRMRSRTILMAGAILEALTGLALIVHPAWVVRSLLGGDISGAGLALGRVAGIGLLSLGLACWPRTEATLPTLRALFTYNLLTTSYLAYLRFGGDSMGKLLLPAMAIHAVFTLLLARGWFKHEWVPENTR